MSKPTRHQRRRTKGYRMPPGVIYVGRPSKWGNPFMCDHSFRYVLEILLSRNEHEWRLANPAEHGRMKWIADHIEELHGKDLACWCSLDEACHADALIEFANREAK